MIRRATRPAAEPAAFAKNRSLTVSDGTPIAYTLIEGGGGAPILYVNGWSCPDAYWAGIVPALFERGHTAIIPDARGTGRSGLPRAPGIAARNLRDEDVSVARNAQDLIEVLDDVGVDRAVLAGHSMGGQILFEAWRQAPSRVAGLIPIAAAFENPVRSFADLPVLDRIYPFADALFRALPLEWLRVPLGWIASPELACRFAHAVGLGGPRLRPEDLAPHVAQIQRVNLAVLWRVTSEMRRHSAADVLPEIDVPVLILAGRADYFMPPSVQERMRSLIPGAEIEWFDEGTHLLPLDHPEIIVETIAGFLARRI